jgi:hypothetical protein
MRGIRELVYNPIARLSFEALSFVLAVSGLVCLVPTRQDVPSLLVLAESPVGVGELLPGHTTDVAVTLVNRCRDPVRVVGSGDLCAEWGCLFGRELPVVLAPGSARNVRVEIQPARTGFTGPFSGEIVLYTDCPGWERLPVRFVGVVSYGEHGM